MKETQYMVAAPCAREAIVDFANFVFSQAHKPLDFKTLLPIPPHVGRRKSGIGLHGRHWLAALAAR